ncbi:MAG: hypothetical protein AB9842_11590 [Bacteroidales bacterium]
MNSGDWVENLSSLEYNNGSWTIYNFLEDLYAKAYSLESAKSLALSHDETIECLVNELKMV